MVGFFSSETTNTLTKGFDYLVDWSRVAALLRSGHHYTTSELMVRGAIIASVSVGGYVGYHLAVESGFGLGSGLYSMAGCFVGFVVSHTVMMLPLLQKRYEMNRACRIAQGDIIILLVNINKLDHDREKMGELVEMLGHVIQEIMTLDYSDHGHVRASQTLGTRRAFMEKINDKLSSDYSRLSSTTDLHVIDELISFWSQEKKSLHASLRAFKPSKDELTPSALLKEEGVHSNQSYNKSS